MVPHSAPAARAATMPRVAVALVVAEEEATASSVAPQNIVAAPPATESQRTRPEPRSSRKSNQPQKIPNKLFRFQSGKAMLSPMLRIAKIVRVLATAHRHPASTPQRIRCGAWRTSRRICAVPRMSAGRLQRARKTPETISSDTITGEMPMLTSFVGASAAPSQAPALKPERIPMICNWRRRLASSCGEQDVADALSGSNRAPRDRRAVRLPESRIGCR